ncbi:hypothetical protein [Treponema brennaborense]|uniref:Uncharacterized protein n=1 Tax=Treponema brennaborense (strain DSM 12168 / CIP 105900 / DD5/3) TaxID=906968 RepID=F4LP81_TREBD|nr:hypothetical protein [Treponema brennaborense]AEE16943.1 hypothetical protein Trebr_1520 [Treponema brennaborense DSM 12168]
MPFNFEHNEASTNDLPERNTELDRYGVWVKTPPRTIHDETEPETTVPDEESQPIVIEDIFDVTADTDTDTDVADTADAATVETSDFTADADFAANTTAFEDVADTADAATFETSDFAADADFAADTDANSTADAATFEDSADTAVSEDSFKIEDFELPDFTEFDLTDDSAELPEEREEISVPADFLTQETEITAQPDANITVENDTAENAEPAEFAESAAAEENSFAEKTADTDEAVKANGSAKSAELMETGKADEAAPAFEDIEFTDILPDDTAFAEETVTEQAFAEPDAITSPEDNEGDTVFEDVTFDELPDMSNFELPADAAPLNTESAGAENISGAENFSAETSADTDNTITAPGAITSPENDAGDTAFEDGEISLDDFFGDDTNVSLDEFMPNESKKEKSDILDEPEMDIALSFDDDFVMNTAADPVTQMETIGGESSAEQESVTDDSFNFDDMFDNIVDESQPEPEKSVVQESIEFDEVTDFDDLLDSITDAPPPSASTVKTENSRPAAVIDYNISVTMDDDSQEFSSVQTETDDDAITEIPLYGDSGIEKSDKNEDASLDRTLTSQYTSTTYTDDSDFDIDKIMSEVEDIGGENMPADTADCFQDEEKQNETQPTGNDIFDVDFFETPQTDGDTAPAENTDAILNPEKEFDVSDFDVTEPAMDSIFTEEDTAADMFESSSDFTEPDTAADMFESSSDFTEPDTAVDTFEFSPDFTEPDTAKIPESEETPFNDIPVEIPDSIFDEPTEAVSSETDFVEPDTTDMPDAFDEPEPQTTAETAADDICAEPAATYTEATECAEAAAAGACAEPAAETAILRQIAAELATLREEISSLKTDFEDMKKHGAVPAAAEKPAAGGFFAENGEDETIALSGNELSNILNTADFTEESGAVGAGEPALTESEISEDSETETKSEAGWETGAGFFDEHTEDETIALSGNELSNILNTADFTEETDTADTQEPAATGIDSDVDAAVDEYEESDNGLPAIDFESEKLEEPVLENIDFAANTEAEAEQELPQEIEIPKVEDILVESSDTDLIDDGSVTANSDDIVPEENAIDEPIETAISETLPEETPVAAETPAVEEAFSPADEAAEDETTAETETEPEPAETEAETEPESEREPEPAEEEISDEPTEEMFNSAQWDAPETQLQESAPEENPEAKKDEIPGELKQEIKSVLSYMDQLLENLPEEKIAEFAQSEHFELYKKLFTELGLS